VACFLARCIRNKIKKIAPFGFPQEKSQSCYKLSIGKESPKKKPFKEPKLHLGSLKGFNKGGCSLAE
jgi:hypothetical protein